MEEYLQHLFDVDALCNQFRTKTEKHFFTDRQTKLKLENISDELSLFCFTPLYQTYFRRIRRVLELCLDILAIKHMEKNRTALDLRIYWLEDPAKVKEYRTFDEAIGFIQRAFIDAKNEIEERLSLQSFSEFEINRLNEAIHCFFEGCYYSTVAASVYVIESKLLSLMKSGVYVRS